MRRTHEDYVCKYCFRHIEECICNCQPYELILIDKQMQHIIQSLNDKFYRTLACCEGHYNSNKSKTHVYISFDDAFAPKNFPKGWEITTDNKNYNGALGKVCIYGVIKYKTATEEKNQTKFLAEQAKRIKELTEWAESLPICEENEYV